jgi:hypothetical protein
MDMKYRYFSCKKGHVVSRFGTKAFIGCRVVQNQHIWNEDEVVAIPVTDTIRYLKEYNRVLKDGAIIERTQEDYDSWIKVQESKSRGEAEPADSSETKPDNIGEKPIPKRKRKAGNK